MTLRKFLSEIALPGDYSQQWKVSSECLAKLGVYAAIANAYPFTGKNVIELGVGPGEEAMAVWQKKPGMFLGIDDDMELLRQTRDNLQEKGYPVNLNLLRRIPMFDLKDNCINLAPADYTNPMSLDIGLGESFDFALFTFPGGSGEHAHNFFEPMLDTIYPLLRPSGRVIYLDRWIGKNPKVDISTPQGYNLEKNEFVEAEDLFTASFWGNRKVVINDNGKPWEVVADYGTPPGAVATAVCGHFKERGYKLGISVVELVKDE